LKLEFTEFHLVWSLELCSQRVLFFCSRERVIMWRFLLIIEKINFNF